MSDLISTSVGEALRQAILAALRVIETRIAKPAPSPADVHVARRAAKRARALARLAPRHLAVLARQTASCANAARRMFGGARDADVRRATLAALRPRLAEAHDALAAMAGADPSAADHDGGGAIPLQLASLMRDWSLCDIGDDGDEILDAAIAAYRRARRRARAAESGGARDLHRWRSAVVAHEYHANFLSAFAPDMRAQTERADRLRQYLGDINDFDMLAQFVRAQAHSDEQRAAARKLEHAVAGRRAKLVRKARRLGDETFAQRPAKWGARLKRTCAR